MMNESVTVNCRSANKICFFESPTTIFYHSISTLLENNRAKYAFFKANIFLESVGWWPKLEENHIVFWIMNKGLETIYCSICRSFAFVSSNFGNRKLTEWLRDWDDVP